MHDEVPPAAPPLPTEMLIVDPTETDAKPITSPAPPPPDQTAGSLPPSPPPPPPATIKTSERVVTPTGTVHEQSAVTVVNSTYVNPPYVDVRSAVHVTDCAKSSGVKAEVNKENNIKVETFANFFGGRLLKIETTH
jgi:hypothetical protein